MIQPSASRGDFSRRACKPSTMPWIMALRSLAVPFPAPFSTSLFRWAFFTRLERHHALRLWSSSRMPPRGAGVATTAGRRVEIPLSTQWQDFPCVAAGHRPKARPERLLESREIQSLSAACLLPDCSFLSPMKNRARGSLGSCLTASSNNPAASSVTDPSACPHERLATRGF